MVSSVERTSSSFSDAAGGYVFRVPALAQTLKVLVLLGYERKLVDSRLIRVHDNHVRREYLDRVWFTVLLF